MTNANLANLVEKCLSKILKEEKKEKYTSIMYQPQKPEQFPYAQLGYASTERNL